MVAKVAELNINFTAFLTNQPDIVKDNLLKSFFSSGLQAVSVQVIGVVFFTVISYYLPKESFGIINGSNAIAMFITTVLSFGMEQVVVRRIAVSDRSDWAAAAYLFHAFAGSLVTLLILSVISFFFGEDSETLTYLPLFFMAQSIIFIATSLKQFLNAKHNFVPYGIIAMVSNVVKIALAFVFLYFDALSVKNIAVVLIICSSIEFISLLVYVKAKTNFSFRFKFIAYIKLIKESSAQYLAVLFDSSLSRIDWILLLFLSTEVATADYALAYRAYEISRLPIVIVAPIILNIFSRMLANGGNKLDDDKKLLVRNLFTVQIFAAMLIPLILNILWSPALDAFFHGKYGSVNNVEFVLLSICIPLQFVINLFWTLCFAARKYRKVTTVIILTASLNVVLNLILIPLYDGKGAAIAYLATTIFQVVLYYGTVRKYIIKIPLNVLILFMVLGAGAFYIATHIPVNAVLQVLIAVAIYIFAVLLTRKVRKEHFQTLQLYLKK